MLGGWQLPRCRQHPGLACQVLQLLLCLLAWPHLAGMTAWAWFCQT